MSAKLQRIAIVACLLAACGRAPAADEAKAQRPESSAGGVRPQPHLTGDAGWLGVVLPRQSLDLAPEVSGQVEQIYVREGDPVRRGQTVAVLDAAQDRQEVAIAEVNLRAAEAEVSRSRLDLADADNRLAGRLAMPDAFPKEEIRRSEIQKQMAEASLEGARARAAAQKARLVQAADRASKAEIRASADGTVARRYVEPGALAGPGQPVVRLISDERLIVRFAVSPDDARSLRPAMPVGIAAGGGTVPAVVEWVAPEVDPPSGLVILVAALDPTARLKPGSVVRVRPASAQGAGGGAQGAGAGRRSSAQRPWTGAGLLPPAPGPLRPHPQGA